MNRFIRTKMLFGEEAFEKIKHAHVAVFGLGGVGGYAVEALARAGVGKIDIVDSDTVALSNINRQILATEASIGRLKADVEEERIISINPKAEVRKFTVFYMPQTAHMFDFSEYDYIIDAIDTVTGKMELIKQADKTGTPIISCMGTGNKTDPSHFEVSDIYKTSVCPLAKVIRSLCRKNKIKKLKVVYSKEEAVTPFEIDGAEKKGTAGRTSPASCSFVPPVAGFILAGEVIKDLCRK